MDRKNIVLGHFWRKIVSSFGKKNNTSFWETFPEKLKINDTKKKF